MRRGGGGVTLESSENALIMEWLGNWALFRSRYMVKTVTLSENKRSSTRRVRRSVKWRDFSSKTIRRQLVRGLGELYDEASKICMSESLEAGEKEKWFRLCAYIAQTINTLVNAHDKMRIEESIKNLEKFVKENIEA